MSCNQFLEPNAFYTFLFMNLNNIIIIKLTNAKSGSHKSNFFLSRSLLLLCNVLFRYKIEFSLDANNEHQKSYLHLNYLICLNADKEQYKCLKFEFDCLNFYQLPTIDSICDRLMCLLIEFVICCCNFIIQYLVCLVSIRSILDTK